MLTKQGHRHYSIYAYCIAKRADLCFNRNFESEINANAKKADEHKQIIIKDVNESENNKINKIKFKGQWRKFI